MEPRSSQPLTPSMPPLLDSQDAHMLPERWCPVGRSTDSLHRVTSGTERGRSPQSGTTLYGSDSEGPDGPLGSHRAPCGDCLRLGVRDPGECCRVTVRDACGSASLCGRLGADRISAENYLSSQMGSRSANSEQPCAVQRDCMGLLPFSSLQSRVCALAALCARSELA